MNMRLNNQFRNEHKHPHHSSLKAPSSQRPHTCPGWTDDAVISFYLCPTPRPSPHKRPATIHTLCLCVCHPVNTLLFTQIRLTLYTHPTPLFTPSDSSRRGGGREQNIHPPNKFAIHTHTQTFLTHLPCNNNKLKHIKHTHTHTYRASHCGLFEPIIALA